MTNIGRYYKDPVGNRVKVNYSLSLKDNINMACKTDISSTRLYQSKFHNFSPVYEIYQDALFLPYKENYHIPKSRIFQHWAYDRNLAPILIADHYKPVLAGYSDHIDLPRYPFRNLRETRYISGLSYYMGLLNPHYGHFIQESITRYWLALERPDLVNSNTRFVYHVFDNFDLNAKKKLFNSNLMSFLNALGINKEQLVFIKDPTHFENIIVPESSISISDGDCYISSKARDVWLYLNNKMSTPAQANIQSKKIYLSRSEVKNPIQGRVLTNEKEIESYFKNQGFEIVAPELLSQEEMQTLLNQTRVIAGNPGSGLQNSFFIPRKAITIGLTCLPIMKINPGLNHQVNTDIICGHETVGFCTSEDNINIGDDHIHWSIDISKLDQTLSRFL